MFGGILTEFYSKWITKMKHVFMQEQKVEINSEAATEGVL